jgi:hypothetical protein
MLLIVTARDAKESEDTRTHLSATGAKLSTVGTLTIAQLLATLPPSAVNQLEMALGIAGIMMPPPSGFVTLYSAEFDNSQLK